MPARYVVGQETCQSCGERSMYIRDLERPDAEHWEAAGKCDVCGGATVQPAVWFPLANTWAEVQALIEFDQARTALHLPTLRGTWMH